jgi:hypothetical protein
MYRGVRALSLSQESTVPDMENHTLSNIFRQNRSNRCPMSYVSKHLERRRSPASAATDCVRGMNQ